MKKLEISSKVFKDNGFIPKRYTGFGEDMSPDFKLDNICEEAISIAITMDDLDIPFIRNYNHWVIWNIPKATTIPENIPHGKTVDILNGAVQGEGWGKNKYRGPKQPFFIHKAHRYEFTIYVLDTYVELDARYGKKDLIAKMDGHILQKGNITAVYKP